ncbi:hypothetical protein FRB99_001973 [Tulasnella sp. 403]|nr:hypothetical protein FRB99_001973 [Tulasnella sp. 403]
MIAAVAPEFAGMGLSAIQSKIMSPKVLTRYVQGRRIVVKEPLPPKLDAISFNSQSLPPSAVPPDVLLRVHNGRDGDTFLFPCHAIFLLTHFSEPSAPWRHPNPLNPKPMYDIILEHPATFGIIMRYIYSHSVEQLMATLLPIDRARLPPSKTATVTNLACAYGSLGEPDLLARLATVRAVFVNAARLSMMDSAFWNCVTVSWRILSRALDLKQKSQRVLRPINF